MVPNDIEEPSVLTADLSSFFGGCEKCPGFTEAGFVSPDHRSWELSSSAFIGATRSLRNSRAEHSQP